MKHQFYDAWRKARRALSHRNLLLKQNASYSELEPWTHELATHSLEVHALRKEYLATLSITLNDWLTDSLEQALGGRPSITYNCGWDDERDLIELLLANIEREKKYGHTMYGPHRADLNFQIDGKDCGETLSRGQLKLFICILKIAQARQLSEITGKYSVFLIDDLPSELDNNNQRRICELLAELDTQIFITTIDTNMLRVLPTDVREQWKLFHVKHGKIFEQTSALPNGESVL